MQTKELICIVCPRGCHLKVEIDDDIKVSGAYCPRGVKYGKEETTCPMRVLTSTVKCDSHKHPRCPVKTATAIPKDKLYLAMREINKISVKPPIEIGDVLIEDILGTGVNLLATRSFLE